MTDLPEQAALARAICNKWARKIGLGFHLDNVASDYIPPLSAKDAAAYDSNMATLFEIGLCDPYEYGAESIKTVKHKPYTSTEFL